MDMQDGIFEFVASEQPAAAAPKAKHESVLPLLGEEFMPASPEAEQRLANAAQEAIRIIASEK